MAQAGKKLVPALGYRWLTPLYDPVVAVTTRERRFKKALLEQANLKPGMEVLDLGCGTGTLAVRAKQLCADARVVGLDADPVVLALAESKAVKQGVQLELHEGISTALPFPNESFDRVLSSLFFHHLSPEDKRRTLEETWRVLRPGGELHIADWGRAQGLLMRLLFLQIQLLDGFSNTGDNVRGQLPVYIAEAGFSEVAERETLNTIFGTLSLHQGVKPLGNALI